MKTAEGIGHVFFDLDGTLTDSAEGIVKSVQYSVVKMGLPAPPLEDLKVFVGPPLMEMYQSFFGFTTEEAAKAVSFYRQRYVPTGMLENAVYDGIVPMLERLLQKGKKLYVATSKPEVYSRRILKHFQLDQYFTFIGGASLDSSRNEKGKVIRYVMETCQLWAPDTIIMVGDRLHDILGAKECGLRSIGVTYGYGSREELIQYGADFIAETVPDIDKIIQ